MNDDHEDDILTIMLGVIIAVVVFAIWSVDAGGDYTIAPGARPITYIEMEPQK